MPNTQKGISFLQNKFVFFERRHVDLFNSTHFFFGHDVQRR